MVVVDAMPDWVGVAVSEGVALLVLTYISVVLPGDCALQLIDAEVWAILEAIIDLGSMQGDT